MLSAVILTGNLWKVVSIAQIFIFRWPMEESSAGEKDNENSMGSPPNRTATVASCPILCTANKTVHNLFMGHCLQSKSSQLIKITQGMLCLNHPLFLSKNKCTCAVQESWK
jgi:hypothetical protein